MVPTAYLPLFCLSFLYGSDPVHCSSLVGIMIQNNKYCICALATRLEIFRYICDVVTSVYHTSCYWLLECAFRVTLKINHILIYGGIHINMCVDLLIY